MRPPRSAAQGCSATRGLLLAVALCAALVLLSNQTHIQAELTSAAVHTHTSASVARPDDPRERPPPAAAETEERRRAPHQPAVEPSRSQPASTPAPTPAAARRPGLGTFPPPPSSLTLVFGNSEMAGFVYNWLAHARRVPGLAPYSAVALDDGLVAKCTAWNEPVVPVASLLSGPPADGASQPWPAEHATRLEAALAQLTCAAAGRRRAAGELTGHECNVRNQQGHFKALGFVKASFALRLLAHGYDVLLSDADSVFFGNPWPWLGRLGVAPATAALAGGLLAADLIVTNDIAALESDGLPSTVLNSGVLFLRATPRTRRFVLEWAARTIRTSDAGNDQTELNRLLTNRYRDGDWACNDPRCGLPRPWQFVPVTVDFTGPSTLQAGGGLHGTQHPCAGGDGANGDAVSDAGPCHSACRWDERPSKPDAYSNLSHVPQQRWQQWSRCLNHQRGLRRTELQPNSHAWWMWGGRIAVGILPLDRFLQGQTFFVRRLHEQRGVQPVHVHVTYNMGLAHGKRWRLRQAGAWLEPAETRRARGAAALLQVVGFDELVRTLLGRMALPAQVWACEPGELPSPLFGPGSGRCYHPKHLPCTTATTVTATAAGCANASACGRCASHAACRSSRECDDTVPWEATADPAAPHVMLMLLTRLMLRNALALGSALGRTVMLPRLWALCERDWMALRDCRRQDNADLPMPYEAPLDLLFESEQLDSLQGVALVESTFLEHELSDNPDAAAAATSAAAVADLSVLAPEGGGGSGGGGGGGGDGGVRFEVAHGTPVDTAADELASKLRGVRRLRVDARDLLRLSRCGFSQSPLQAAFQSGVTSRVFRGQYSHCSHERNPNVDKLLAEARRLKKPEEPILVHQRNCTGNPDNPFNKPKVNLGPAALAFRPARECSRAAAAASQSSPAVTIDGAELAIQEALALYGGRFRGERTA